MSVLDQIDNIIKKEIKGYKDNVILALEINDDCYCIEHLDQNEFPEHFNTKTEMTNWLNENGWRINTLSKS